MENILNVTWEDKAALYAVEDFDDYAYRGYLKGASDFQEQALKCIQQELDIFTKGNTQHALVAKICFEEVIQIITNLEANE